MCAHIYVPNFILVEEPSSFLNIVGKRKMFVTMTGIGFLKSNTEANL